MKKYLILLSLMFTISNCVGLEQFPSKPHNISITSTLKESDPDYLAALYAIDALGSGGEKIVRRNLEISRRLRVIDIEFDKFVTALAQENVKAQFGTSIVLLGVGGAGALVEETASQILSAVSAGVAGAEQAYGKAALFDQALPALLAQMIASRKAILVRIMEGMTRSVGEYPLSAAIQDLDAYYFAGSLPGSVVATSADATQKNAAADAELDAFRVSEFYEDDFSTALSVYLWPPDGNPETNELDEEHGSIVREWMDGNGYAEIPVETLIHDARMKEARKRFVEEHP